MVFKCQEDSYLKEYTSKVISCEPKEFAATNNGKQKIIKGYEVILENTVLFPEGGGQPCDLGFLNEQRVYCVNRRFDQAVHYVEHLIPVGEEVKQIVDWKRRIDHMQQHSGQHLISAIFDRKQYFTASWYLGEDVSYVELEIPSITQAEIDEVESTCNELIREGRPVTVQVYPENTPSSQLDDFRSRKGLPADHKGDIRIVTIENVEGNMCCGTHVTNLSQLQAIKLLHAEKSKRKGNILLHFLVGNRVLDRLDKCIEREKKLTATLNTNAVMHPEFVEKLSQNVRLLNKNLQTVLKDLAVLEAQKLKSSSSQKYYILHRKEAEADFMNYFIKELGRTDIFLFLSVGDDKKSGNIVLYGEEAHISELGNKICEILGGKGAGKGNKFQAKVTEMSKRKQVEKLLKEYFN